MTRNPTDHGRRIELEPLVTRDGREFPSDFYRKTAQWRGTQGWVANNWATGALYLGPKRQSYYPEGGSLASSTGNFRGIQHTDRSGTLWHYNTIEAIRTRNLGLILNSQCWARGFARCTTPRHDTPCTFRTSLPLSYMDGVYLRRNGATITPIQRFDIYSITEVIDGGERDDDGYHRLVVTEDGKPFRAAHNRFDPVVLTDTEAYDFLDRIDAPPADPLSQ